MLNAIINRRSVRFYRNEPVSEETILEIIHAGFLAPCAHGKHPLHVVIITNAKARKKLAAMHKWTKHIGFAPVALVVCVDKREMEHFWIEDASAFMENLLIEATNQNLGSCWIAVRGVVADGIDVEQIVRDTCNIPEYMGVLGITPLGLPARHPGPHTTPLPNDRIHYEAF